MCESTRSGSESVAETYWDILGTWEDPVHLSEVTGNRVNPVEQADLRAASSFPGSRSIEKRKALRHLHSSRRQVCRDVQLGSLSALIVAIENRETLAGGSL